jgi:uncharacterized membrane protein YkvA (DUF1232 family)
MAASKGSSRGARSSTTRTRGNASAKKRTRSKPSSRRAASTAGKGPENRAFRQAQAAAEKTLKDPKKAKSLADKAGRKFDENWERLGDAADELQALIRLIQAYAKGEYRDVPWTTLVAAAGAVVYFVMPIDLIPDVLFPAGYTDDITVALFVVAAIERDLDAFQLWEIKNRSGRETRAKTTKKSAATTAKKQPPSRGKTKKSKT